MKSGLEGRNNATAIRVGARWQELVSMKSGLEGRNNCNVPWDAEYNNVGLNEVRPGRPEQLEASCAVFVSGVYFVSMKSGLEGRNNGVPGKRWNEVTTSQ